MGDSKKIDHKITNQQLSSPQDHQQTMQDQIHSETTKTGRFRQQRVKSLDHEPSIGKRLCSLLRFHDLALQKCDFVSGINILSKNSKVIQDDYDPLDDDDLYKDRNAFKGHHEDEAMQREDDFDEDSGNC